MDCVNFVLKHVSIDEFKLQLTLEQIGLNFMSVFICVPPTPAINLTTTPSCNAGDLGSFPGLGRSPGKGKGYPLQYSCLENPMDCIVHRVAKNKTCLSDFHFQETKTLKAMQQK